MNYTDTAKQNLIAAHCTVPNSDTAVTSLMSVLKVWYRRATTRRQLARLDSWELEDIGVDYAQARAEARKPFWKA